MKFRKLFNKTIVLAAVAAACLSGSAMAEDVIGTGIVEGQSLRLRSEASPDASIVTYLDMQTQVDVYEDLGDWFKISWNDYTGYVSADYLTYTPAAEIPATSETPEPFEEEAAPAPRNRLSGGTAGMITGIGVNLRVEPSADVTALTQLDLETEITVLEILDGGWTKVEVDGQTGYVKSDYVAINGIPVVDPKGTITGSIVNFRAGPSTDSAIISKLSRGTQVALAFLADGGFGVI